MAHSELCPVCKGKGKVKDKNCHGCFGKGWVTIYGDSKLKPLSPSEIKNPYWTCTTKQICLPTK
jgi:hypothetical protein